MRILLTGAGGFVGRHLRPALRDAFPGATLLHDRFEITDPAACDRAVREGKPDACIHLAAVASPPLAGRDPGRARAVNVDGAANLGRAITAHAPGAAMLFASSSEAYGNSFKTGLPLDEDATLDPASEYGRTKRDAEAALRAIPGLKLIVARAFNHTGPGQSADYAIPSFARQLALVRSGRQRAVRVGNLDAKRFFIDVRDMCDGYTRALRYAMERAGGGWSEAFVFAPNDLDREGLRLRGRVVWNVLLRDILAAMIEEGGLASVPIEIDPDRMRSSDIPVVLGDAAKARERLGWSPRIDFRRTLRDVIADWETRVAAGE